jgi:hypothetical protein
MASLQTSGGSYAFPGMTPAGGNIWGIPAFASAGLVPSGSPTESELLLLDEAQVAIGDEGASLSVAKSASLQMSDAPASGATSLVSLWQLNLRALRCERYAGWARASDSSVVVLTQLQV